MHQASFSWQQFRAKAKGHGYKIRIYPGSNSRLLVILSSIIDYYPII